MAQQIMQKPSFTKDQLISASVASKNFGTIRKRAQQEPLFILDNGQLDTVILGYAQYEKLFLCLQELEEIQEAKVLEDRLDRLERNPEVAIPWRKVRRTAPNE